MNSVTPKRAVTSCDGHVVVSSIQGIKPTCCIKTFVPIILSIANTEVFLAKTEVQSDLVIILCVQASCEQ